MDQTYCILCPDLAREYNGDLGVDHWTLVKIILSEIRICFSIMEVKKKVRRKGYIDTSFGTDRDDSKVSIWIHIESGSN